MSFAIRDAAEGDLPAILAIHNDAVLNGTALWTIKPSDLAGRRPCWQIGVPGVFPFLVCTVEGTLAGYGSFGDFRPYDGYARTVEHSIYVDHAFQRRGIATALLVRLIEAARALGKHVMVGAITADNIASIALHARHGFVETGRMPELGFKFGRPLDLVLMQRLLDGPAGR